MLPVSIVYQLVNQLPYSRDALISNYFLFQTDSQYFLNLILIIKIAKIIIQTFEVTKRFIEILLNYKDIKLLS